MSKMTVVCDTWHALRRNTLQGFATVRIAELQLILRDVAVHEKEGQRWAQPPAKPQVKDGALVKDASGKVQYAPIVEFGAREVRDAFSRAVIDAVIKHNAHAFDVDDAAPARAPVRADMDDKIGF